MTISVGNDSENREEKTLKSAQSLFRCYWQSREKLRLVDPSNETRPILRDEMSKFGTTGSSSVAFAFAEVNFF